MSSCTVIPARKHFHVGVPVLFCGTHNSRILPVIISSAANPWLQRNSLSPEWMLNTCLCVPCERAGFCQHHPGERKVVRGVIKNLFGVTAWVKVWTVGTWQGCVMGIKDTERGRRRWNKICIATLTNNYKGLIHWKCKHADLAQLPGCVMSFWDLTLGEVAPGTNTHITKSQKGLP